MTPLIADGPALAHWGDSSTVTAEVGYASWQVRWAARWRWLARRWGFALAGLGLGLVCGWGVFQDPLHDYRHALQAVHELQQQVAAQPRPRAVAKPVQPEALTRLPVLGQQAATWLALQQVLTLHRVSVLSLRPLQDLRAAPLPNQGVALRLQARFGDWVAAWSSLNQAGPVWSIERIRITPMAAGDALEIDAVLRVWMREDTERSEALPWVQAAMEQPLQGENVAVFASPQGAGLADATVQWRPAQEGDDGRVTQRKSEASPVVPQAFSDPVEKGSLAFASAPERLPFSPWRLLGIWEHAGQTQAFLASDTHWFRGSAGQSISQEGHRLETVATDRVVWRDPQGQRKTLTLESRTP